MEFDQILPNLYVGFCPLTSEEIDRLQERGVTAVLNLQSVEDFEKHKIDWPTLSARYKALGITLRQVPIRDFDKNDLGEKLPKAVQALDELLDDGHTVFIHCNAGVNRSPSVIISYLHWSQNWDLEEAVRHVQRCHRSAPVMEVIQRVTNDRRR